MLGSGRYWVQVLRGKCQGGGEGGEVDCDADSDADANVR